MALRHIMARARLACLAGAAAGSIAGAAQAQTGIKLSLDERLEGPAALFLLPQDRGYYRSEGLDVTIEEGSSALEPITRVASGGYELGFADINALIRYHDQNPAAPVKAVFMLYNKPPFAIVGRKSRGISDPKSLEDKKLGAPPTGATYDQWPIFAKLNDIEVGKVAVEKIGVPVRAPMLAAGQIDAVLGYSFRVYVDLKDRGVPLDDVVLLPMANYGLKLYGSAVIVNAKFAAEKPEAVAAFLRAFLKGLKDTIRNPSAAVDSVVKREDLGKKEVELERLRMAIRDNIITPEARANGLGAIDGARLTEAINQIGLTYAFKAKPKASDVFDPAFLPAAAERKLN
ncbi:MAG: NitT/TauT family transport system substrate-binding protein [Sphingomonadales bacterium]|nr:NitT/TauT family transport system substrate-binding protein [Sphingomonadales bacterium]